MTHIEIVKKLIGEIRPVGDSCIDETRLKNLEQMCSLVGSLIYEIHSVSLNADSHEHSVSECGLYAKRFINKLIEL